MERKTCTMCNDEKFINNFYKKYTECKKCNSLGSSKRKYKNKEKISNQRKMY